MRSVLALLFSCLAVGALYMVAGSAEIARGPRAEVAWAADLALFFLPWIVLALAVVVVLPALAWRRPAALVGGLALIGVAAGAALATAPPGERGSVRIATINVLISNEDTEAVRAYLRETRPDVVVLQEIVDEWPAAVAGWTEFPVRVIVPGTSTVVLSRLPLSTTAAEPVRALSDKVLRVEVTTADGRPLVVYGIHPTSPRSLEFWKLRNWHLGLVAEAVAAEPAGLPVVVAGDWNTPPWSPFYRRFMARSGLSDDHEPAWPAATRISKRDYVPAFFGSPVDRIVVSPDVRVIGQTIGPDVGSDHLPIVLDVALPPAQAGNS